MKRYVQSMALGDFSDMNPARAATPNIKASITQDSCRKLLKVAAYSGNKELVDGLLQLIIDDLNADIYAGLVPNADLRKTYRKFYELFKLNPLSDPSKLHTLDTMT